MRQPKPYFKASHKAWYVNLRGKTQRLGTTEEEAWQEYYRLMADEAPVTSKTTVVALLDRYLIWTKENRAPRTYDWYLDHLQSFARYVGAKLKVGDLKPYHVTRWLQSEYKTAGNTYKRGACVAVNRAFNWARRQGLVSANPIASLEKPAAEPREAYLSEDDWAKVLAKITGSPIADIFEFMRETGCRPWEASHAEARHWDRKGERLVLDLALTKGRKGKKLPRVIRLNARATEIIKRLSLKHPEGPLFRNRLGNRWTAHAMNCCCVRLRKSLGIAQLSPYVLRHSFCTDALLRGVDPTTVALLMGHKDGAMVMKVYNHLVRHDDFLKEKLRQATTPAAR